MLIKKFLTNIVVMLIVFILLLYGNLNKIWWALKNMIFLLLWHDIIHQFSIKKISKEIVTKGEVRRKKSNNEYLIFPRVGLRWGKLEIMNLDGSPRFEQRQNCPPRRWDRAGCESRSYPPGREQIAGKKKKN